MWPFCRVFVSWFGILVRNRLVFSWYFPNRYWRKTRLVHFGIVHLAGIPFSLASAPFLMDQAPLLRGVPAKFHKMELPPNLTVQKITYIPYRIYQPASAGNLPIPAKLPVNRWDTTLLFLPLFHHSHHIFGWSWWSAALVHTIASSPMTPQPSAQVSPPHHGR